MAINIESVQMEQSEDAQELKQFLSKLTNGETEAFILIAKEGDRVQTMADGSKTDLITSIGTVMSGGDKVGELFKVAQAISEFQSFCDKAGLTANDGTLGGNKDD